MGKHHITLYPSSRKNKKWAVRIGDKCTVHFGDSRYEDYTMHRDDQRKSNYLARHKSRENWRDKCTAGFWSRWLLWNKKSIAASIRHIQTKFGVTITKKRNAPQK